MTNTNERKIYSLTERCECECQRHQRKYSAISGCDQWTWKVCTKLHCKFYFVDHLRGLCNLFSNFSCSF